MNDDRLRAFLAFEIDDRVRAGLVALERDLQPRIKGVRWASTSGWHVTLRFLGEAARDRLDRLGPPLRAAAAACPRSEGRVGGLGLFPERGGPRLLWIGVSLPPPVLELQAACEEAAVEAGFVRETRPFRAHLTLGRWRDRAARPELPGADLGPVPLEALVLFRSELRRSGAVHTPLASFPLAS